MSILFWSGDVYFSWMNFFRVAYFDISWGRLFFSVTKDRMGSRLSVLLLGKSIVSRLVLEVSRVV